jgi:peptidoglycan pentaglycine glycine transferase (the first glycine)
MASPNQPSSGQEWDRLVAAAGGHLLQTWPWGELKARFGWQVERVAAGPALAQVLFRPLPAGLGSIAYVPRGPAGRLEDPAALSGLLAASGPWPGSGGPSASRSSPTAKRRALAGLLQALGFTPSSQSVQPRRTLVVDLQGEAEAVLGRMKQKTRYNVRLAARKGVTVRPGSEADLPAFYISWSRRPGGMALASTAGPTTRPPITCSSPRPRLPPPGRAPGPAPGRPGGHGLW